ncbi:MAG: phosphoribosylaminoimidazolesuccinocarboxamide synthase [Planctomycetota bacterium]|jgi:phosphoribosylaminoimidazole-succinocarboxamide synthase
MPEAVRHVEIPGLNHIARGKVRDIFEAGDQLLLVTSDRLSAFDVVLDQGIPGRGVVLTKLSEFWFKKLAGIIPHHLISTDVADMPAEVQAQADVLGGRTMLCKRLDIVPVECVVRGYLAGSGWKEYQSSRSVCGVALPEGLENSSKLPEPIFTPTTKAATGHDMPMTFAEVEEQVGAQLAARLRDVSLALYTAGAEYAAERGILLADTKFELGLLDGELVLADEVLTPDSSRYWDRETYAPGRSQDSFDKQVVRDYLETLDWDKQPPPPTLPDSIIEKAAGRYVEISERLMG